VLTDDGIGLQGAVFRVGCRIDVDFGAGMPQRAVVGCRIVGILPQAFGADAAAELEAGFGAGNEAGARTLGIADADVFQRLRLGSNDRVGRVSAGCSRQRSRGAEKKALDVHGNSVRNMN